MVGITDLKELEEEKRKASSAQQQQQQRRDENVDDDDGGKSIDLDMEVGGDSAETGLAEGNFIDDDFGLTSIRLESEQIKRQQLLIEQEVRYIMYALKTRFFIVLVFPFRLIAFNKKAKSDKSPISLPLHIRRRRPGPHHPRP